MPRDTARFPVAVGDPVKIVSSSSVRDSRYGRVFDGVVSKVGRTLITVTGHHNHDLRSDQQFTIATGIAEDHFGHWMFQTVAEFELGQRRRAALATFARHNLGPISFGEVPLDTETLERMVRAITDPEPGH
jgi:hypothetical protein